MWARPVPPLRVAREAVAATDEPSEADPGDGVQGVGDRRRRVVARIADHLLAVRTDRPWRVAIDGITAAGKTTFADELAAALRARGAPVVRISMDGFHHPRAVRHRRGRHDPDGYYLDAYDFGALAEHVLGPLGPGGDRRYRPAVIDLATDTVLDPQWCEAPGDAVVVVDGSFLQRELRAVWDDVVFLDCSPDVALARGVERDADLLGGAGRARELFAARYHPACRRYLDEHDPAASATVVVGHDDPARPELRRIGGRAGTTTSLFSYGTLQQPEVQVHTFGRHLAGRPAAVTGFAQSWIAIADPAVVAASGLDRHPVVTRSDDPHAEVTGTVFEITTDELAAADLYEVDDYRRTLASCTSGEAAWLYVAAELLAEDG